MPGERLKRAPVPICQRANRKPVAKRERLSELGGWLDIESGQRGTILRPTLPLRDHSR